MRACKSGCEEYELVRIMARHIRGADLAVWPDRNPHPSSSSTRLRTQQLKEVQKTNRYSDSRLAVTMLLLTAVRIKSLPFKTAALLEFNGR